MWGNLSLNAKYAMVEDDAIVCAPSPFIATDDWFLLGVLNSHAADWYVHQVAVTRSGGYMEYKPVFVEQIPIPTAVESDVRGRIAVLAQSAQQKCQSGVSAKDEEREIDELVYAAFGITAEERQEIEQSSL
ncbi:restriction endonuclease [Bifidobacterium samirii]|uniref:Restriction endonuclease n=1 Tax=Bifidobacterium samirii TaxID=2306974 RepID=A0A430FWQ7_9BIFI|nr:restriction endonuclease [Bifidobacterium samirii]